jgi:hypothetical protein
MSATMKVEGKTLVIRVDLDKPLVESSTGKTLMLHPADGEKFGYDGKSFTVNLNVFTRNPAYKK